MYDVVGSVLCSKIILDDPSTPCAKENKKSKVSGWELFGLRGSNFELTGKNGDLDVGGRREANHETRDCKHDLLKKEGADESEKLTLTRMPPFSTLPLPPVSRKNVR